MNRKLEWVLWLAMWIWTQKTLHMWCMLFKSFHWYICINHSPYQHIFITLLSFPFPPISLSYVPFFSISHYPSVSLIRLSSPPSNHPSITLKVRLVPVSFEDPDFLASYKQSVALYARYQMTVHGDAPSECGESEVYTSTWPIHNCMKHTD